MPPSAQIDLDSLGSEVLLSVVGFVGLTGASWLTARAARVVPNKRLWHLEDPEHLVVCVAASGSTDTGQYMRPVTGLGQVQALAVIMPSLSRAYPHIDVRRIQLSSSVTPDALENDLICLGGVKNNLITDHLLTRLGPKLPFVLSPTAIEWRGNEPHQFTGEMIGGVVKRDCGVIVQTPNPFARNRQLVILAGLHTYGTIAAARHFVQEYARVSRWRHSNFAAVVETDVIDGYACPPEPARFEELASS